MNEIKKCQYGEQNKLAKDLGISRDTFHRWKKEFGLPIKIYSESEKLELMNILCRRTAQLLRKTTLLKIRCPRRRMTICGPGILQRKKEQKESKWNTP
uniref:Helix-turn-helix domain-containing protein n=1 Tax=Globodera pallida TaxID=36090 RepID=A0A183CKI8_GLOPA